MAYRHRVQRKHGGRMDYTADSKVAREAEETGAKRGGRKHHHHRKAGGKVPGLKSGGRADRFARGGHVKGSNKNPFSSAAMDVDHGRTTHNVGASPAHDGAPHHASKGGSGGHHAHKAGGHHPHKLHGHHGKKDHPGHHFAEGGAVPGFKHGGPVMHMEHGTGVGKDHAHKGRMHFHHKHRHHHKKDGGAVAKKAAGGPVAMATGGPTTMKNVFASGGLIRGKGGRFAKGGAATPEGG